MPKYYELEVSLIGVEPKMFRRFVIPVSATFADLHDAIQEACGWEYSHLHSFQNENGDDFAMGSEADSDWGPKVPKDHRVKLYSYFGADGKQASRCIYLYDFGDSWEHDVRLVRTFEEPATFKRKLLDGARAFPPEDCGGLPGYEDCCEALSGKRKSRDAAERREWLGNWSPEAFDLKKSKQAFDA